MEQNIYLLQVSGFAKCGKDTFVSIARDILEKNGYTTTRVSFADALKHDLDAWLTEKYQISAWTSNPEEKELIRPFFVAHGCGKRKQTAGKYWVDIIHHQLIELSKQREYNRTPIVVFNSDCRFLNEAKWGQEKWSGQVIHLKKYETVWIPPAADGGDYRKYDSPPNEEEAKNDPMVEAIADIKIEWEQQNYIDGNILKNEYLNGVVLETLNKTKFFATAPLLK